MEPRDAAGWVEEARARLAAGSTAEAVEALRMACARDPEHVEALADLGLLLARSGIDAEAIPLLERAVELGAEHRTVHRALAEAYGRQGNLARSARAWRYALSSGADPGDAQEAVGVALSILFLQREAAQILQRIASSFPSAARHAVEIGRSCYRAKNLPSARAAFEAALVIDPREVDALTGLGAVAVDERRYEEAISCFEKAVALAPEKARHHVNLAIARRRAGDKEGARTAWTRAAALSPDDENVRRALAEITLDLGANGGPPKRLASGEQSVLAGELGQFLVPDLVQLFHTQRAHGLLVVERAGQRAAFSFRAGNLAGAVAPGPDDAASAPLSARVAAALGATFDWPDGQFAFYRAEIVELDVEPETIDAQHALLDALRLADEAAVGR